MDNQDFIHQVSLKSGLTDQETEVILASLIDIINIELKSGKSVKIEGLGKFQLNGNSIVFEGDPDLG